MKWNKPYLKVALVALAFVLPGSAFGFIIESGVVARSPAVGNPNIYSEVPLVTIRSGGPAVDTFQMNWNLTGYTSSPLAASALFTIRSFTSNQFVMDVQLNNLTNTSFQSSILALGLGVSPNVTALISPIGSPDIYFDAVSAGSGPNQTFPGGFKNIDVCAYAGNTCSGGSINDGIVSGADDLFRLTLRAGSGLTFGSPTSVIALSDFALKFQTQAGSYELPACIANTCTPNDPGRVPEPSTLMLGAAAVIALLGVRRKNNKWKKTAT